MRKQNAPTLLFFILASAFSFFTACTNLGKGDHTTPFRQTDDFINFIRDTNGILLTTIFTDSSVPGHSVNYDFGSAWDSLGQGEEKKQRLDSLKDIGFVEETNATVHEKDSASFNTMLRKLLFHTQLSNETKTTIVNQLCREYLAGTLFPGGSGFRICNYRIGDGKEFLSIEISLGTTTALQRIATGTVTNTISNTATSQNATYSDGTSYNAHEDIGAGKLGFRGTLMYALPAQEDSAIPAGYRHLKKHVGLNIENAIMLYDTATVASPNAAILCMKVDLK